MKIIIKSKNSTIKKGGEKRMRYSKVIFAFSIGIFVIATMAFLTNTWAVEDVRNTKHNLYANTNIGASQPEVCVFCHTPHGGDTGVGGSTNAAPLWNRAAITTSGYTLYTSPNFDGFKDGNLTQPAGVSAACLSCHDGTVAFDALINAPGSGGYDADGLPRRGYTFSGTYVDDQGTFKEDVYPPDPMPNLTKNLLNDHPISIRICDTAQTPTNDPQFTDTCTNSTPHTNNFILKLQRNISLLSDVKLPVDIRDQVRAYKTAGSGGGWYVECASCHNPHEASRKGDPTYDPTTTSQAASGITYSNTENDRFLRFPSFDPTAQPTSVKDALLTGDRNAGSLLCLTCHQK